MLRRLLPTGAILLLALLALLVPFLIRSVTAGPQAVGPLATAPSPASQTQLALEVRPAATFTPAPSEARLYWGAWLDGPPIAAAFQPGGTIATFERQTQKGMALVHWGLGWKWHGEYQPFPATNFDNIRSHGSIPLLDWGSWTVGAGPAQADFRLSAITAGRHDAFIRGWAQAAKAWGHPFFLRFDWQMNGDWQYPWSEQLNGNRPGDYVEAWRHVHDIFTEVGAENVTWVWCANVSGSTTRPYAPLFPGNTYVDWTCLDGYNFYDKWIDFEGVFAGDGTNWLNNSYQQLLVIAPNKPMLVVTGSLEADDDGAQKAAWIANALGPELPQNFPKVKAVVWFNWDGDKPEYETIRVESSPASALAFSAAIGSDIYASNVFTSVAESPIPPLP